MDFRENRFGCGVSMLTYSTSPIWGIGRLLGGFKTFIDSSSNAVLRNGHDKLETTEQP